MTAFAWMMFTVYKESNGRVQLLIKCVNPFAPDVFTMTMKFLGRFFL